MTGMDIHSTDNLKNVVWEKFATICDGVCGEVRSLEINDAFVDGRIPSY